MGVRKCAEEEEESETLKREVTGTCMLRWAHGEGAVVQVCMYHRITGSMLLATEAALAVVGGFSIGCMTLRGCWRCGWWG